MTVPAMSLQGTRSLLVGIFGGKFLGQRRSPLQGDVAWTWIRCSVVLGVIWGIGRVVRIKSVVVGDVCRRARVVLGRNFGLGIIFSCCLGGGRGGWFVWSLR